MRPGFTAWTQENRQQITYDGFRNCRVLYDRSGRPIPWRSDDLTVETHKMFPDDPKRWLEPESWRLVWRTCPNCGFPRAWQHDNMSGYKCYRCTARFSRTHRLFRKPWKHWQARNFRWGYKDDS